MSFPDFVDLCSDDEAGEAGVRLVKQELDLNPITIERQKHYKSRTCGIRQGSHENGSIHALDTVRSNYGVLDQGSSVVNGNSFASTLPAAPLCRQFWKAGDYDDAQASKVLLQSGQNHLRVHPKFLHSNATSHKWAFGAIAELLDNAIDEIQNGATFVMVDKTSNPRDGSPALLIQDDGGGMDPESMRHCMSFGFSHKKSKSAIGQYGNGFKTSTMRLGADVIVFSRHIKKRTLTQSVGLLSYTFLRQTGHDRIVVPMVDYEFDTSIGKLRACNIGEIFSSNLSMLLQWSPYRMESELLKQFDDMGHHGTKVIIYNLWFNDDGDLELDFESDAEDILISGAPKTFQTTHHLKMLSQQHIANRLHYSLRVYSSILYLRVPEHFRIILRGRVVEHHNIAKDLKFREFIVYKPQIGGNVEASVLTTIGFLKDAPHVNIHGFSVYHRNRLIMPFWRVVSQTNSRGRGVAGVLEANFMEPTHNKQDFEKTTLFQKLEARLKDMTLEYWDYHCGLIGYQVKKSSTSLAPTGPYSGLQPVTMNPSSPAIDSPRIASIGRTLNDPVVTPSQFSGGRAGESISSHQASSQPGLPIKRKGDGHVIEPRLKKLAGTNATDNRHNWETQPANGIEKQSQDQEAMSLIQENKKLHSQCLEYEKSEEELNLKVQQLRVELIEVQREYARLLAEAKLMDPVKVEEM